MKMASKKRQVTRKPSDLKEGLPLIPNAGVEHELHKAILALLNPMVKEINAIMKSEGTMDATLKDRFDSVTRTWQVRFDEQAKTISSRFSVKVDEVSFRNVAMALQPIGLKPHAERDQVWLSDLREIAAENAKLIANISQQYSDKIAEAVTESMAGTLEGTLADRIVALGEITKRRAKNISRDQNASAYSKLNEKRMLRVGVKRYIWRHSSAGKKPRPSHVAAHGDIYEYGDQNVPAKATRRGDIGPPGTCPNCRCYAVPIVDDDL